MMTKKLSSLFMAILLLCSIFIAVFLSNVSAMNDEQNLSGLVWQSNGDPPTGPTRFCIWVRHSGTWYRFPETETEWAYTDDDAYGLWWYSYVLEDEYHPDRWENGDTYRVQVDGEPWNDYNSNATSNGTGSAGDPFPPFDPANPASTYNDINYLAGGGYLNEQQWDVRTLAQIDLAPTNITAKGEKPVGDMPVPPATLVPIIFNVTNFGQSDSGPFWISLWNCTVTGVNIGSDPIAEYSVSSLGGGNDTGALPPFYWLSPSPPGTYHINITVDSRYEVPEYDETNNRVILHFVTGPDLNITNVLIWGSAPEDPFYVAPKDLVQIFATVVNEGQSSTGADFFMALYNITGPNGSIIPGDQSFDYTIGELDVGGTATRSWNWTAPPDEGDYYVNITADYGDQILEANELNNHFTIHFNVTKIPITKINHTEPIYYYTYNFVTYWYLNSSTELYFEVPDQYQFFPPYYTWYRIINRTTGWVAKGWTNFTEEGEVPFTLELWGEETYRIEFYSIDSVGAQEPIKNKIVIVDDSEPLSSVDFDTPKYRVSDSDNWNITSATNITLSAIDHPLGLSIIGINNAAGINAPEKPESGIFYRIKRVSDGVYVVDWTEPITSVSNGVHTAEPFILPYSWTEGYYIIEINSTDNLGQKEVNSTTVYLDNIGPTTYIYGGQDNWNAEQNAWEIDFSTLFTLDADDGMGSGVDYIEYRITLEDGTWSAWQTYTTPFNLTLEEHGYWDHTIQFRSYDNLGNRGQPDTLNVYIEGDITPPRPPLLRLKVSGDDIVLEWEHSPDPDIDHYLIYKSTTRTGFNFSVVWVDTSQDDDHGTIPLRTTWNHTGAVIGEPEYYYCMRGVDLRNNIGYTSNIAGKVTMTFEKGYNDFALPLEPFEEIRASEMLSEDVFADDADTLYRYDTGFQQWMGHPKFLPASIDDFVFEMGEGYRLLIMEDSAQYTFTGSTGTSIRYIGGIGQDMEFRQSLSAEANENQVSLTWNATPHAISYSIYRASARMGTGSLTDYDIESVAQVPGTSWTDTEATGDEYYYMVVADSGHGEESGTYGLGVKKFELKHGYTSFSLVLDPKPSYTIANFSQDKFPEDEDTIYFYDLKTGYWQGHPRFLPENINNGNAVTGRGYMIFTSGETTKFTLIGL